MSGSFIRRAVRGGSLAAVAAALSLTLVGTEALAWHVVGATGSAGHYSFHDTAGSPGAKCIYGPAAGTWYFDHVRVKAPVVYWPDQNSGNPDEHGTVGWRIKIQNWQNGVWVTTDTGPQSFAIAHENSAAPFGFKILYKEPPPGGKYRVQAIVSWYHGNGTLMGRRWVVLDNYRRSYDSSIGAACPGRHRINSA